MSNNKPTYEELENELRLFKNITDQNKLVFEELQALVDTAPVGLIIVTNRVVEYMNERFSNLLDYSPEEAIGRTTEMFYINRIEYERVGRELYEQIQKFGFGNLVALAKRKDGELLDVIISSSFVDPEKKDGSIIFSVIDITSIRKAQALKEESRRSRGAMEKAQALLAAAVEQSTAGIVIADAPHVNIRVANSAALGIRGISNSPLVNIPYEDHSRNWQIYHPDGTLFETKDLPLTRAILEGVASKNVEVVFKRSDGTSRWALTNAAPVRDKNGNIIAGVAVFPDITDIKQAEERLRLALIASKSGVWEWDVINDELFLDKALCNIYGFNNKFDGKFSTYLLSIHPHDRELIDKYINRNVYNIDAGLSYDIEHRIVTPDGKVIWIQNTGQITRNEDGAPNKIVGIASDITERKRAEGMLLSIVEGTSKETGRKFFKKLVRHIAGVLECEFALVGILANKETERIKTLAFWEVDRLGKNIEYNLNETPHRNINDRKLCLYNSKVHEGFSENNYLVENKIEAYMRIPLFNLDNEPIGVLTVMSKKPFPDDIIDNARSLLTIFASRAEAELQRMMANDELMALAETLKSEQQELSEKNVALRQVLDLMEQEKNEYKFEISSNIDNALAPFLKKLKKNDGKLSAKDVGLLEDTVKSIVGKEMDNFRANYEKLTSREIDICELINKGMTSQEIADELNLSIQTVQKHRSSIRKKLQLKNKEINLTAYLRTKK